MRIPYRHTFNPGARQRAVRTYSSAECYLRWGDSDSLGDRPHAADDGQVGAQRVLLEARQPASEVVLGQVVE
jgi:hypothetical protein